MNPGDRVRLRLDPSRSGVLVKTRPRGSLNLWLVQFPDQPGWIPEDQLEPEAELPPDPIEMLAEGQLSGAAALRRLLTHVRLSGRLANVVYSMETTNTEFYAHQFKPVLKFLNSPASGLLIADEVGLGKTIEAGLVWTELRSRYDAQRLLVLCPAVLQGKWKTELYERFGVEAEIVDAKRTLEVLQGGAAEGRARGFAMIGSFQGLRPRRGWDDLEEETTHAGTRLAQFLRGQAESDPLFDLLVIDEAHYLRNPESMTAALGRVLKAVAEHVLLLSATPVHLRSADLYYLLNLLDEDTFNDASIFDAVLEANEPLVRAREMVLAAKPERREILELLEQAADHFLLNESKQLRSLIEDMQDEQFLANRRACAEVAYRLETLNLLGHAVSRTRKREVHEWIVHREAFPEPVPMTPAEERFYVGVTDLVRKYSEQVGGIEAFLVCMPQRQVSSSMPAALRHWLAKAATGEKDELYEDLGYEGEEDERPGPLVSEIVRQVSGLADLSELERDDSKFNRFQAIIQKFLREHPQEKVVVFSYFRATLSYLAERLGTLGIRAAVLSGDVGLDKTAVLEHFKDPAGPRVLLSSEVGSEGIDLQFCRVMVNYDLPWNPMRVEQRIGRLDRLGQESKVVSIWNLFYQGTIDDRIYARLYQRLEIFKRALGGLEEILGKEIQKLTLELLSGKLSAQQEEHQIERAAQVLETVRLQEEQLEADASNLVAYGDYILNQVKAARELKRVITGQDIEGYVVDYLRDTYPGTQFALTEPESRTYDVELAPAAKADLGIFVDKMRLQRFTALHRPSSGAQRCRFENKVATPGLRRIELLGQLHPLVRFVSAALRAKMEQGERPFWPAVAVRLPQSVHNGLVPRGQYAFVVLHWSVEALQSKEHLFYTAMPIGGASALADDDAEKLVVTSVTGGQEWIEARNGVGIDLDKAAESATDLFAMGNERFNEFVQRAKDENTDRVTVQIAALERHLETQLHKLDDIKQRLLMGGRRSLARATEGRMSKLRERVEIRRLRIEGKRDVRARPDLICVGVIDVL